MSYGPLSASQPYLGRAKKSFDETEEGEPPDSSAGAGAVAVIEDGMRL